MRGSAINASSRVARDWRISRKHVRKRTQRGKMMYTDKPDIDIVGFDVEAVDGGIGKIDEATQDISGDFVVVDTGPWIFGKDVVFPADLIQSIDEETHTVFLAVTKDEIKDAPEYDESRRDDALYREELGSYYGRLPGGPGVDPE